MRKVSRMESGTKNRNAKSMETVIAAMEIKIMSQHLMKGHWRISEGSIDDISYYGIEVN